MRWKEFLKPDWRRVVITILLSYITFLIVLSLTTRWETYCTEEGFRLHPESCGWHEPALGIEFDLVTALLISIMLSYLLSCLLAWGYDKVRKK